MPDEIGTETTRSDAPSADESLFGDAETAEEQDVDKETEQDPKGSDDIEGEAGASETNTPEDLKVVVSIKGGRTTIGVQGASSDPHIESFDDQDLSGLAQEVLPVIERAKAKWEGRTQASRSREARSPGQAQGTA